MNHSHLYPEIRLRTDTATRRANTARPIASTGLINQLCKEVAHTGCAFAGGLIDELQGILMPQESGDIAGAVPKRVREFIAGRTSARLALAQLGYGSLPIPRGESRAPVWPHGVTGSISHNSHYCVAVAALDSHYRGIGIDLETDEPLSRELAGLICTHDELTHCERQGMLSSGVFSKLIFSAKESVYKCLFPVFGRELEFEDVVIKPRLYMEQFTAHLLTPEFSGIGPLRGRFSLREGLLMTMAVLPAASVIQRQRMLNTHNDQSSTSAPNTKPARGGITSSFAFP